MATHPYQPGLLPNWQKPGDLKPKPPSLAALPETDNGFLNDCSTPREYARKVAEALSAGAIGANTKQLASYVLEGLLHDDV